MKQVIAYVGGIGSFLVILFLFVSAFKGEMTSIQEWISFTAITVFMIANIYNVFANGLHKRSPNDEAQV